MRVLSLLHRHPALGESAQFDLLRVGAYLEVSAAERLLDGAHEFAVCDGVLFGWVSE